MELEKWKEIKGFKGKYFVSNLGNIRSAYTSRYNKKFKRAVIIERIKDLKQCVDKQGYKIVTLYKNNKRKTYKVHRLVAETFIPNPKALPVINHINENKIDNNVKNLEWCTQKQNVIHSIKRLSQRRRIVRNDGKEYESIADAMKELGLKSNHISDVCNGKRKKAGGYSFRYKEANYGVQ